MYGFGCPMWTTCCPMSGCGNSSGDNFSWSWAIIIVIIIIFLFGWGNNGSR